MTAGMSAANRKDFRQTNGPGWQRLAFNLAKQTAALVGAIDQGRDCTLSCQRQQALFRAVVLDVVTGLHEFESLLLQYGFELGVVVEGSGDRRRDRSLLEG